VKKIFILAIVAVFAMTGMAMAQDQIRVSVTSEPIPEGAAGTGECHKAGGFSLAFDQDTTLNAGEQIVIDLDLDADICPTKADIDLQITNGGHNLPWTAAAILANTNNDAVYYIDENGDADLTETNGGVYFQIWGESGDEKRRIIFDIKGAPGAQLTVGNDPNDALVVKFLDGDRLFDNPGVYKPDNPNAAVKVYNTLVTEPDNTLCIALDAATKIQANMDSQNDKYTFLPSNPQVSHIGPISTRTYELVTCKGRATGNIIIGARGGGQSAETCMPFDNEFYDAGATITPIDGFCLSGGVTTHGANNLIIRAPQGFATRYDLSLEILVNGVAGNNGVYFSDQTVAANGYDAASGAWCASDIDDGTYILPETHTWYAANGNTTTGESLVGFPRCDVTNRAVRVMVTASTMGLTTGDTYLHIDIPAMVYDLDEITAGDVVAVRVSIVEKTGCGTNTFADTWQIGTMGCDSGGGVVPTSYSLSFPYLVPANDPNNWWTGVVVVNMTNSAGSADLTIYEMDGDVGTLENVAIGGRSMMVNFMSNIIGNFTLTTGSGTLGDAASHLVVETDFMSDGFLFMGDPTVGWSMGYLPRK